MKQEFKCIVVALFAGFMNSVKGEEPPKVPVTTSRLEYRIRAPTDDEEFYPKENKRQKIEGRVLVEIEVKPNGRFKDRKVVLSDVQSNDGLYDDATVAARKRFEERALLIVTTGRYVYSATNPLRRLSIVFQMHPCKDVRHYVADEQVLICAHEYIPTIMH